MSYKVQFNTASTVYLNVGCRIATDNDLYSTKDLRQSKQVQNKIVVPLSLGNGDNSAYFKGYVKLKHLFKTYDETQDSSVTSSNPIRDAKFQLFTYTPFNDTVADVYVSVKFKYYVKFYDRF